MELLDDDNGMPIRGAPYTIYAVFTNLVAEAERDDYLRVFTT